MRESIDWFDVDCRQLGPNDDMCGSIQPGLWHIVTFHGIGTDADGWLPIPLQQFTKHVEGLAKQRDSAAVEVVTFKDAAERLRRAG